MSVYNRGAATAGLADTLLRRGQDLPEQGKALWCSPSNFHEEPKSFSHSLRQDCVKGESWEFCLVLCGSKSIITCTCEPPVITYISLYLVPAPGCAVAAVCHPDHTCHPVCSRICQAYLRVHGTVPEWPDSPAQIRWVCWTQKLLLWRSDRFSCCEKCWIWSVVRGTNMVPEAALYATKNQQWRPKAKRMKGSMVQVEKSWSDTRTTTIIGRVYTAFAFHHFTLTIPQMSVI